MSGNDVSLNTPASVYQYTDNFGQQGVHISAETPDKPSTIHKHTNSKLSQKDRDDMENRAKDIEAELKKTGLSESKRRMLQNQLNHINRRLAEDSGGIGISVQRTYEVDMNGERIGTKVSADPVKLGAPTTEMRDMFKDIHHRRTRNKVLEEFWGGPLPTREDEKRAKTAYKTAKDKADEAEKKLNQIKDTSRDLDVIAKYKNDYKAKRAEANKAEAEYKEIEAARDIAANHHNVFANIGMRSVGRRDERSYNRMLDIQGKDGENRMFLTEEAAKNAAKAEGVPYDKSKFRHLKNYIDTPKVLNRIVADANLKIEDAYEKYKGLYQKYEAATDETEKAYIHAELDQARYEYEKVQEENYAQTHIFKSPKSEAALKEYNTAYEAWKANPNETTKAQLDAKEEAYKNVQKELIECPDDGAEIDIKMAQKALLDYVGADGRDNRDERRQAVKELGLKKYDHFRDACSDFGISNEIITPKGIIAGTTAGTMAALPSLLGLFKTKVRHNTGEVVRNESVSNSQSVASTSSQIVEYPDDLQHSLFNEDVKTWTDAQGIVHTDTYTTSMSKSVEVITNTNNTVVTDTTEKVVTEIFKEATDILAKVCPSLIGVPIAGAVLSGLTAMLLNNKSQNIFKGMTVDAAIADPTSVQFQTGQGEMVMISRFKITGDTEVDNKIKTAVLQACIGNRTTSANRQELLGAMAALKQVKELMNEVYKAKPEDKGCGCKPTDDTTPENKPVKPDNKTDDGNTDNKTDDGNTDDGDNKPCVATGIAERDGTREAEYSVPIPAGKVRGHGQSRYYIAQAYVNADGSKLSKEDFRALMDALGDWKSNSEEHLQNRQIRESVGGKLHYRYRKEITLPNGKIVKLCSDDPEVIAKKIDKTDQKLERAVKDGTKGTTKVKQTRRFEYDCQDAPDGNSNAVPEDKRRYIDKDWQ